MPRRGGELRTEHEDGSEAPRRPRRSSKVRRGPGCEREAHRDEREAYDATSSPRWNASESTASESAAGPDRLDHQEERQRHRHLEPPQVRSRRGVGGEDADAARNALLHQQRRVVANGDRDGGGAVAAEVARTGGRARGRPPAGAAVSRIARRRARPAAHAGDALERPTGMHVSSVSPGSELNANAHPPRANGAARRGAARARRECRHQPTTRKGRQTTENGSRNCWILRPRRDFARRAATDFSSQGADDGLETASWTKTFILHTYF